MDEIDAGLYSKIKHLCAKGDSLAENRNFSSALESYWQAIDLVPEPKTDWDISTWILTAIGDANFLANDFHAGVDNLSNALRCPGAIGNPFIHMRLGQCQYEVGNLDNAADELTRAYSLEGEEIFSEDDPKYLEFLKKCIEPPLPKKKSWWKR